MEIGQKLVELCREGRNIDAINELYADDVVSIEATAPPAGGEREMRGIEAVRGKNQWWQENHEVHDASVAGPFPHGDDRFAVHFNFDVTSQPMGGQRFQMEEVALYTIENGKIAKEEFFYAM
jgi:ketosteroid isomerase-like protein